jgi:sugar lactone lactonase YvrE
VSRIFWHRLQNLSERELFMQESPVEVLIEGIRFPESPRWHDGALWFSDMYGGAVYRLEAEERQLTKVLEVPGRPSGIGWLPGGDMLVVSMHDRVVLRAGTGGTTVHAELGALVTGDPNDMIVDSSGRAYVGNFGKGYAEGGEVEPANLVIIEPDGSARAGAEGLLFPNGPAISFDGKRLIVAEGFRQALTEFRIGDNGDLYDRRLFADLAGEIPDGIALDTEDGVWVAFPLLQEFARVERGGNVTTRISVGPRGAFACALGGVDGRTLFMCTALGTREQIRDGQSEGSILGCRVAVASAARP